MFVFEKNPTSKLDKSGKVLINCNIVVMYLGTPLKKCGVLSQVQFMSRCGIILQILCENSVKKACRKLVAMSCCLLRENLS